ncbi:MAG: cell division FtsA domain-containing protein, partial [bacterium]
FCLVLDVGASETEMIVVYNGRLVFARSIAFGGRDFTSALAKSLDIKPDRAEHLKLAHGEVVDRKEIDQRPSAERPMLRALADAADEFHSAINASLMFAETQTRLDQLSIGRIYLSGAGARLDGLRQFLARRFEVRATFFRAPDEWGAPGEPDRPGEWVIALGLALLGLQGPAGRFSLLPPSARRRRGFWRRDVFSWAAAALFLGAAAVAALGIARAERAKRKRTPARQQLLDRADSRERELRRLVEDVERARARADRVSAAACAGPAFAGLVEAVKQARQEDAEVRTLSFETGGVNRRRPPLRARIDGAVDPFAAEPAGVVKAFAHAVKANMPEPERWTVSRKTSGLDEHGRTCFTIRLLGYVPGRPAGSADE